MCHAPRVVFLRVALLAFGVLGVWWLAVSLSRGRVSGFGVWGLDGLQPQGSKYKDNAEGVDFRFLD